MNLIKIIKYILYILSLLVPFTAYFLPEYKGLLWDFALYSVFILMCLRPFADIFPQFGIRRLVPLRKQLGIFSATIIVSFGIIHYISLGFSGFIEEYFSLAYWSFEGNLFWAHMGELTGFLLLITSNRFSIRLLKRNWKRLQRLSYVYFFSGSWYVFASFEKTFGLIAIIIVFELTLFAFIKKRLTILEDTGKLSWRW